MFLLECISLYIFIGGVFLVFVQHQNVKLSKRLKTVRSRRHQFLSFASSDHIFRIMTIESLGDDLFKR